MTGNAVAPSPIKGVDRPERVELSLSRIREDLEPLQNLVALVGDPDMTNHLTALAVINRQPGAETLAKAIDYARGCFNRGATANLFRDLKPHQIVDPQHLLVVTYAHSLKLLEDMMDENLGGGITDTLGFKNLNLTLEACLHLWQYVRITGKPHPAATRYADGAELQDLRSKLIG
jgi:hypothetical protein